MKLIENEDIIITKKNEGKMNGCLRANCKEVNPVVYMAITTAASVLLTLGCLHFANFNPVARLHPTVSGALIGAGSALFLMMILTVARSVLSCRTKKTAVSSNENTAVQAAQPQPSIKTVFTEQELNENKYLSKLPVDGFVYYYPTNSSQINLLLKTGKDKHVTRGPEENPGDIFGNPRYIKYGLVDGNFCPVKK